MSTHLYGAVLLSPSGEAVRRPFQYYWHRLAILHGFRVKWDGLDDEYLDESLARIWPRPDWVRFRITGTVKDGTAERFFYQAAEEAGKLLNQSSRGFTVQNVWLRVPQWRGLLTMLWHQDIEDAYLVVENASGDLVEAQDAQYLPLSTALAHLWLNYVHRASEDACLYHIDLALPPELPGENPDE